MEAQRGKGEQRPLSTVQMEASRGGRMGHTGAVHPQHA